MRNAACSCYRWGEAIFLPPTPTPPSPPPPADISSFSRMAAKVRKQPVTDQDVLAVEEQICHPIVVDQYDICALVKSKAVKKLQVALFQVLCESLELQVPSPKVRRKAPYLALLQNTR